MHANHSDREGLKLQTARIIEVLSNKKESPESDWSDGDATLIGVVGPRGSGKTTLLRHLCKTLREDDDFIVLPIIRPEMLATSESLLLTMLSSLVNLPLQQPDLFLADVSWDQLTAAGQKALRSAIFASTGSIRDLFDASASIGQFAVDSTSILSRVSGLNDDLSEYLEIVFASSSRRGIVVPIDDIDLGPGRLSDLLVDVRAISHYVGLHPIACFSWDDLKANLRAETQRLFPSFGALELERLVDQQVMKTLRPDRVFEPLQLPRNGRLAFAPEGEQEPLGDLLASTLAALDSVAKNELSTWLLSEMNAEQTAPFAFAWLPGTFRALEHLYYEAKGLRRALLHDTKGLEIAQHLRAFLACISRENPGSAINLDVLSIATVEGRPRITVSVEWPGLAMGVAASTKWSRVFQDPKTRISLRETTGLVGEAFSQARSGADHEPEDRRKSGLSELSSGLLAESILATSLFESPRPAGPLSLLEASCEFLQSVRVVGLPTNDRLLLLPASAGMVNVDRWVKAWNWVVRNTPRSTSKSGALEGALAQLCVSVCEIWWFGRSPEETAPSPSAIEAVEKVAELYVRLASAASDETNWAVSAQRAFCEWFETLLPQSFHEALVSESTLGAILEIWQAALSTSNSGTQAIERLRSIFEGRFETRTGQTKVPTRERIWLYGYRALIRSLSSDMLVQLNEFEKEYAERSGRGSKGRDAVDESATLSQSSQQYRYASRVNSVGSQQEADLRRLLDQLRQP